MFKFVGSVVLGLLLLSFAPWAFIILVILTLLANNEKRVYEKEIRKSKRNHPRRHT